VCALRPSGAWVKLVAVQLSVLGSYLPPVYQPLTPPQTIISLPVHASHRREQGWTAILETELVLRDFGPRCQKGVAADEIKQNAKHDERNQCEQVGAGAVKKWIVRVLPILNSVAHGGEWTRQFFRRDHNPRDCATRDVTGSEQDAGAFVAFGSYASANRRPTCAAQLGACARLNYIVLTPPTTPYYSPLSSVDWRIWPRTNLI
jgi:hypothetical protein